MHRQGSCRPLVSDEDQTYTGDARKLTATRSYGWMHPLSAIVGAVLAAGLRLNVLREHDCLAWRAFPGMVEVGEDLFALAPGVPRIPLALSLGASKAG